MRALLLLTVTLTTAVVAFAADAPPAANPPPPVAVAPAPAALSPEQQRQAFLLQGYHMTRQSQFGSVVTQLGMDATEVDALLEGIQLALKGKEPPITQDTFAGAADAFFRNRAEAVHKAWSDSNTAFLAKIDSDSEVKKLPSGLRYRVVNPGSEEKPTPANTVKACYTGRLCDGQVFDTTDRRGGQPSDFALRGVIPGWTEGLQLIGKGGRIRLWIPPEIGYGPGRKGSIPGGSVLDFEIELVDFK